MRICIVGCGAVGSLFAANLATLDDVEVWAFDLYQAHVDAINARRPAPLGCRRGASRTCTPRATPPTLPPLRPRHRRDQGDARRRRRSHATAHAFADGAVASVMNGVGNEETLARHVEPRDPRHDLPGRASCSSRVACSGT